MTMYVWNAGMFSCHSFLFPLFLQGAQLYTHGFLYQFFSLHSHLELTNSTNHNNFYLYPILPPQSHSDCIPVNGLSHHI